MFLIVVSLHMCVTHFVEIHPPLSFFIRTSPVYLPFLYHWQCFCTCISVQTCSKHKGKNEYDVYTKIQCKVHTCRQRTIDVMTIDKHLI